MKWQDAVFTLGTIVFGIALIPMLMHEHKPPLLASIPTAFVLFAFSLTYVTLGFVLAPLVCLAEALMWAALAVQRYASDDEPEGQGWDSTYWHPDNPETDVVDGVRLVDLYERFGNGDKSPIVVSRSEYDEIVAYIDDNRGPFLFADEDTGEEYEYTLPVYVSENGHRLLLGRELTWE